MKPRENFNLKEGYVKNDTAFSITNQVEIGFEHFPVHPEGPTPFLERLGRTSQ